MKSSRIWQIAILPLLLFACQDDVTLSEEDTTDPDMEAAIHLADEHFQSASGRMSGSKKIVIVVKYRNGEIFYKSTSAGVYYYVPMEETSITAIAKPGDYIYWYRGGGLKDLEEIDIDDQDEVYLLDEEPEEINYDLMWALRIPLSYDISHEHLKYDVVYESRLNSGVYIRLDPKIKVVGD